MAVALSVTPRRRFVSALAAAVLVTRRFLKQMSPRTKPFTTSDGIKIHYITMGDRGSC